jgi:hypothetical protein
MATQYFRYARGFKETGKDVCATRELGAALTAGGDMREVFVKVTSQKSFLYRRP